MLSPQETELSATFHNILRKLRVFSLALLTCVFSVTGNAEQTFFHKEETATGYNMQYRWKDHSGVERELSFSLQKNKLVKRHKKNRNYRPEIAQRYVYIEMQKMAQKISPREARVRLVPRGKELQIQVKSQSPETTQKWLDNLTSEREAALDRYLHSHYYARYESPYGQIGVKPDHLRYIDESIRSVLPASQAIYEQIPSDSTPRSYVNLLLSWLQSIPYSTLENRITSNGSGFLPPSEVLINNIGDCDSKAALMAAMLRSLLPNLNMALVYLPNHALLGATLPNFEDEESIKDVNGAKYLLLDPTGPALMKLGRVSESTENFVASAMYKIEGLAPLATSQAATVNKQ